MTNEEILNKFYQKYEAAKNYTDVHWEADERREHKEYIEMLEKAIGALEKQLPKKPTRYICTIDSLYNRYLCKVCGCAISEEYEKYYCPGCGQAINWGEIE